MVAHLMPPDTSNPDWYKTRKAENIIPKPPRSKVSDDLLYLCGLMVISQGPLAGSRFHEVILPWQERIIRWVPHVAEVAIKCGKGPLALDTPLATPTGWTTIGEVQPGDQVFDENGQPCTVVNKSPVYRDADCYRMTFSDGSSVVCDAEHLWQTTSRRTGGPLGPKKEPGPRKGRPWVRRTDEIVRTLIVPESSSDHPQSVYNHRIEVAQALECPEQSLPIPPYTLGVWLADGKAKGSTVTLGERKVAAVTDGILAEGVDLRPLASKPGCNVFAIIDPEGGGETIHGRLKQMGLYGNKHIPAQYLRGSISQRMALLRGLLDCDGTVTADGRPSICQTKPALVSGLLELFRSLGVKVRARHKSAKIDGRMVGDSWNIHFTAYRGQGFFSVPFKACRLNDPPKTRPLSRSLMITGCEPVESVPVQCIEVDSPSHLFLAGEGMTPTHNSGKSAMVAAIALGRVMLWVKNQEHRRGLVAVLAANVESARIVFGHINEAILADRHLKKAFKTNVQARSLTHIATGIVIQILPPKLNRAVGLRPGLLIVDEVHEAAKGNEFEEALTQLRQGGKNWRDFCQISITTAPVDRGEGYYVDWLTRARAVRDGKVKNPRLLPALFEFPVLQRPDLDVENPKNWFFGMPSLITEPGGPGTMDAEAMRVELEEATQNLEITGTGDYQKLLSQRLGIEAEERQGGGQTLLAEFWEANTIDIFPQSFESVVVAIDPSAGLADPFAVVMLGKVGGIYYAKARQWLTHEAYDRSNRGLRRIYDQAIKCGELRLAKTADDIAQEAIDAAHEFGNCGQGWPIFGGDALGLAGFSEKARAAFGEYKPVPQGWQLMAAFEAAAGTAHSGALKHLGQPLFTANVKNLRIDNGRLRKADASYVGTDRGLEKIDGAMALLSAIHLSENQESVDVTGMIG